MDLCMDEFSMIARGLMVGWENKKSQSERNDAKRSERKDKARLCERCFVKLDEGWLEIEDVLHMACSDAFDR